MAEAVAGSAAPKSSPVAAAPAPAKDEKKPAKAPKPAVDAKAEAEKWQKENSVKGFAENGKTYIKFTHAPKKYNWSAQLPEQYVKSFPGLADVVVKAFANMDGKTAPSFVPAGKALPKVGAGVGHFDVTVVVTLIPVTSKFSLTFVRDDFNLADGAFQRFVETRRKWVKVGDLNDFDSLLAQYPLTEYEWAGTSKNLNPLPLVISSSGKAGHRVGFLGGGPQCIGDSHLKLHAGIELWTRNVADSPADAAGKFKHGLYHTLIDTKTNVPELVLFNAGAGGLTIYVRRH